MRRVAVLGAGGAGVCTALELARRGQSADLYDENSQPVSRASYNNEGKIHLGLVYARDTSLKTAETMILGALHFASCLSRWVDIHADDWPLSSPYVYAVHKGSMTTEGDLERHYAECTRLFDACCEGTGLSYLCHDRRLAVERLSRAEMEAAVSPVHCDAAFRTSERSVDPRVIAGWLRAAVHASSRVRFISSAHVRRVARARDDRLLVTFIKDDVEHSESYDQVVNALWHGRLEIDAGLGLSPNRRWIHRYKLGGWLPGPVDPAGVASLTFVLGPFGDVVNFGRNGIYLSWYPAGLLGTSHDVTPPPWETELLPGDRARVLRRTYDELAARCPPLASIAFPDRGMDQAGGVIVAWGETDIDDGGSELHTRHEIGIHSVKNYHSINTGKYTMAPYLGYKTAERVLGIA